MRNEQRAGGGCWRGEWEVGMGAGRRKEGPYAVYQKGQVGSRTLVHWTGKHTAPREVRPGKHRSSFTG